MELCSAGSLFSMLDDPENMYGLAEDSFKVVVHDICKRIIYISSGCSRTTNEFLSRNRLLNKSELIHTLTNSVNQLFVIIITGDFLY